MFLLGRIRSPGIPRIVKNYLVRIFILLCASIFVVILLIKWKYDLELLQLHDIRKAQLKKVQKMMKLSSENSKFYDTWKASKNANSAIFSAYLDSRPEVVLEEMPNASKENIWALIRIIAILDVNDVHSPFTCYYKFPHNPFLVHSQKNIFKKLPAVNVKLMAETENFGKPNAAAFVFCKLVTTTDGRLPLQIAFSTSSRQTSEDIGKQSFVDVHYTTRIDNQDQDQFMALCVPSLEHSYDKHLNLIEFVEFYRMMGVKHFTFYNTSVTEEVRRVLVHYENEGLATVLQWELPSQYVYERNLRYSSIYAAMMNDCLYRNTMIGGYKYITNVDLDEFIILKKYKNFLEMMVSLDPPLEDGKFASFVVRHMFFYLMYEDNKIPQNGSDIPKLLLHTKTTRVKQINPAYDRSKYIARGQDIVEMGNHRVWHTKRYSLVFRTDYGEKIVDPQIAALHHYRLCEVNELICWLRETVIDTTAYRYVHELEIRVLAVLRKMLSKSV